MFGLGGLNESGKNTYVIEIDGKIFVMDCGLKYATDSMYGIDYIIPNYRYLIENKDRVVGIFLTHAHQENMGGVFDLIKDIPNIKLYCTKYTKEYLLLDGMNEKNIIEICRYPPGINYIGKQFFGRVATKFYRTGYNDG